jgi:hypothetical protein
VGDTAANDFALVDSLNTEGEAEHRETPQPRDRETRIH